MSNSNTDEFLKFKKSTEEIIANTIVLVTIGDV